MPFRISLAVTAAALVIATTTGCAPPSPPATPTPTFTSADQAYAAAEKTYRAYVDAVNDVDLSDPGTFEAVYEWTTGDARLGEKKSLTKMYASHWRLSGSATVSRIRPKQDTLRPDVTVTLQACYDVSAVSIVDESGRSVVSPERPPVQSVEVSLRSDSRSSTGLLISSLAGGAEGRC